MSLNLSVQFLLWNVFTLRRCTESHFTIVKPPPMWNKFLESGLVLWFGTQRRRNRVCTRRNKCYWTFKEKQCSTKKIIVIFFHSCQCRPTHKGVTKITYVCPGYNEEDNRQRRHAFKAEDKIGSWVQCVWYMCHSVTCSIETTTTTVAKLTRTKISNSLVVVEAMSCSIQQSTLTIHPSIIYTCLACTDSRGAGVHPSSHHVYFSVSSLLNSSPSGFLSTTPQALYGSCEMKNEESLGVWTLRGTSYSDNGTRVVCQQAKNPFKVTAILRVYGEDYSISFIFYNILFLNVFSVIKTRCTKGSVFSTLSFPHQVLFSFPLDNGISHATLIGCTIGGFFGMLLVAGLSFTMLRRSETLQKCFSK